MPEIILSLFDTSDFPDRWNCGNWSPLHGWIHIISDLAIFGAYAAIPFTLAFVILKKRDLDFPFLFWLFAAFIFSCGAIHLIEATIFWKPWYRLSGAVKLFTAIVSWVTALSLLRVTPKALGLTSRAELVDEISRRDLAEAALRTSNEDLERLVQERTAQLQAERDRLQAIVDAANLGIVVMGRDSKVTWSSTAVAEINDADLVQLAHLASSSPDIQNTALETEMTRRDGSRFPARLVSPKRDQHGERAAVVINLSSQRHAEQLERMNTELKRSNTDLDQFAYIVAHDLQEPLRTISNYLGLVESRLGGDLDEKTLGFIHFVTDGASRMKSMIQDLLLFSRAGRSDAEPESVDVEATVRSVLRSLQHRIESTNADVRIEGPLPNASGHQGQIAQVFQNLIVNALKFRNPDSAPTVRIYAPSSPNTLIRFEVSDNGIGVPDKDADKIFQVFRRLHGNADYDGTGIGLAICKRIVEGYGGTIGVMANNQGGATFYFSLPASQSQSQSQAQSQ